MTGKISEDADKVVTGSEKVAAQSGASNYGILISSILEYVATTTKTLTNKTISAAANTVTGLTTGNFAANVIDTDTAMVANSDTRIASQAATKAHVAAAVTAAVIESSWTPTFTPAGGAFTGATITINQAVYQKIGNWVQCSLDFTLTALGSGSPTGAITATLPFTPSGRGFASGYEQAVTATEIRGTHAPTVASLSITMVGGTIITVGYRIVISNIRFKV